MFEWMSSPPPGASAYDEALLDIWELVGGDVDHHPSELDWQRRWIAALNRGAEPFASTNDGLDLLGVIRPVVGHR